MHKNCLLGFSLFTILTTSVQVQAFSLSETIKQTLKTNPQIMSSLHEQEATAHELSQARSKYLPSVTLAAGVGEERRKAPVTGNEEVDLNREEFSIQAEQIVFDGFASVAEVQRQKSRLESMKHSTRSTAEDLALRTAEVYLNVLRQGELMVLLRESLWEHQNIFDQMKLRSDKGVGSKADLDQIAARLALANANVVVGQNNLQDAQANFLRVTGFYPNLENMQKPELLIDALPTLDQAIEMALENHPVLDSATADFKAAKAQHKAAASPYWPSLKLEAEKRWDENVGGVEGEDEDLVVALRLEYKIFNGGANKARRKQTAKLLEQSKDIRNNARRQVVESMTLSWNSLNALNNQRQYLQAHHRAAIATKSAYKKQFNIGRRTLLDLLNTETEVVEAKRSLINAEYDSIFSHYRILNAQGNLLSQLSVEF